VDGNIFGGLGGFARRDLYLTGMDLDQAIASAATTDEPQLRHAYRVAVAAGANNTGCTAEEERCYGTLRLVTQALLRLPDLAVCAYTLYLLDTTGGDPAIARAVADVAAGALRLAHRALEVHGRDVGYDTGAWIDQALLVAGAALDRALEPDEEAELASGLVEARAATLALTRAAASTLEDRMLVADQLACGLGYLLALFVIARRAAE